MILEIRLSNFFSIKDEVILNLRAGNINTQKSKQLGDNITHFNEEKVLKTIAIYGSNASGKSNVIKAVRFCAMMVFMSHTHNENTRFNFQPFKFKDYLKKPSSFLINFVSNGIEYEYSFTLTVTEIISEELFYYPNGRRAKVFTRNENLGPEKSKIYSFGSAIKKPMDVAENTSRKSLFISRASQMDRIIGKELFNYFSTMFILGYYNIDINFFEQLFSENKELLLKTLKIADNDIVDIKIQRESRMGKNVTADFTSNEASIKDIDQDFVKITSYHKASPEIPFDFDREESEGTKKAFFIMLTILDVVKNNKTLIIDELESSLHSRIVEYIVEVFHKGKNAQLIFSTHNTNLINFDLLRKDQIYFTNKQPDASTELYSLYDYKEFRDTMDAEKAYLQGRFDAVPIVNDSVDSIYSLLNDQKKTNPKR